MAKKPGGWSETMDTTEEIQWICDQAKDQVEAFTGENYVVFTAIKYRSQVVAGENFLLKVDVGEDYHHLSVHRVYSCDGYRIVLRGVEQHRTKDYPLVKGQVEKQTGKNYREFKAVKYRENLGKELFLIKVHVGGADYIHLRVIQFIWLLRCVPQEVDILSGVEQHKTKDDPLVPFTN